MDRKVYQVGLDLNGSDAELDKIIEDLKTCPQCNKEFVLLARRGLWTAFRCPDCNGVMVLGPKRDSKLTEAEMQDAFEFGKLVQGAYSGRN